MRTKASFIPIGIVMAFMVIATACGDDETDAPSATDAPAATDELATPAGEYDPQIDPADFTNVITNEYFSLPVGRTLIFEGETDEGLERTEIVIESGTKEILGVETLIYRDRVYVEEVLVEDTRDYLAQDGEGNVWYFGEEVDNYENGVLKDHEGSFIAGEDGAKPGIWIKAEHTVGDSYRQEYYPGEAEDIRNVVAVDQTVETELATYTGCVQFFDWTPLDSQAREHKYNCPEVGALVLTEHLVDDERAELVEASSPR
jgi:hypothetical protein